MVQDFNNKFQLARKVVFGTLTVFSLVVLGLAASITHQTTGAWGFYYTFAALGIATAILTLLTLPVMLFISIKRQGAITSMIAVEVAWTWFLWILWLSLGGNAATYNWGSCGYIGLFGTRYSYTSCRESQALTAFAFLGWILLFAYNIGLIVFVVRLHMRGHTNVWTSYVTETDFTATSVNAGPAPGMGTEVKYVPSNVSTPNPQQHPPSHYPQV